MWSQGLIGRELLCRKLALDSRVSCSLVPLAVDIRGAELDDDNSYHVYVEKNSSGNSGTQDKKSSIQQHLTFAGGAIQVRQCLSPGHTAVRSAREQP